ncbi:MAG TPA: TIGR01777 family oxidoreductase [Planctomycetota bacterium]
MSTFVRRTRIAAPAEEVFRWHARPGAFERLVPPWERVEVLARSGGIDAGARATVRTSHGEWVAEHTEYREGRMFKDVQRQGPFKRWEHTHLFEPDGDGCFLEDRIEYELPFGGALVARSIERRLERAFTWRHAVTATDVAAHRGVRPLKIAVTGASGLVGTALVPLLTGGGHEVARIRRGEAPAEGVEVVVHLAGEPVAQRWNDEVKRRIRESRVDATRELVRRLPKSVKTFVSASAIGIFGSRGDETLTEDSAPGQDFLSEVCRGWEAAAAEAPGRSVSTRFGMVLSPKGGALKKMLTPFRMGAGGRLGSGRQWLSWLTIEDAIGMLYHAILTEGLSGPVNAVAGAVTNREFTKALGRALRRPTIFPMPGFAARLAFGQIADALLLASQRVEPTRLKAAGYAFRHLDLSAGLAAIL